MNAKVAQVIAEHIHDRLMKQSFHSWHLCEWEDYVAGATGHSTKDEILSDIRIEMDIARLVDEITPLIQDSKV